MYENHFDLVQYFLSFPGVDVNVPDDTCLFGFHLLSASYHYNCKVLKLLLERLEVNVNKSTGNGDCGTVSKQAACIGNIEAVRLLLSHKDIDNNLFGDWLVDLFFFLTRYLLFQRLSMMQWTMSKLKLLNYYFLITELILTRVDSSIGIIFSCFRFISACQSGIEKMKLFLEREDLDIKLHFKFNFELKWETKEFFDFTLLHVINEMEPLDLLIDDPRFIITKQDIDYLKSIIRRSWTWFLKLIITRIIELFIKRKFWN